MSIHEIIAGAVADLESTLKQINQREVETLVNDILEAEHIYVTAAGRSLLVMRCFAMRLMQIGIASYVVGDTCTPAFSCNDLLVTASSSGETSATVNVAKKAKLLGGKVASFTIKPESSLGKISDHTICIHGFSHIYQDEIKEPTLPGGCLFEQSVLLLSDSLIIPLTARLGEDMDIIFERHANLE